MINDVEFNVSFKDTAPITSLMISPDGMQVFSGTTRSKVTQWDMNSGDKVKEQVHEQGEGISTMAFSECSHMIIIKDYMHRLKE